jgi:hypothetical protein
MSVNGMVRPCSRNEGWLKIKTVQKGKFPVIGFVKDPTGVATLYLGKRDGKETSTTLADLSGAFRRFVICNTGIAEVVVER